MKVLKQEGGLFTLLIGKRERDLFLAILQRYPVLSTNHFQKRQSSRRTKSETDELLRESLAEQQKESRRNVEEWLKAEGRFREVDRGFTFTLNGTEMEWMLQVLNDVRVGSWVQLGEPDGKTPPPAEMTEQTMQLVWAVEMAGLFQHELLEALESPP